MKVLHEENHARTIENFRAAHGRLQGSMVVCLPGWTTRWDHLPTCKQVHVTYIDPEKKEWKVLKNLEAFFQEKIEAGEDNTVTEMLETAKRKQDDTVMRNGRNRAKESQGRFEISPFGKQVTIIGTEARSKLLKRKRTQPCERKSKSLQAITHRSTNDIFRPKQVYF